VNATSDFAKQKRKLRERFATYSKQKSQLRKKSNI